MYTEEFEGLEEAENGPRAYVSSVSQQDAEKLFRENEKLKKSLEKEKFFNKLLDQELKDVKAEASTRLPVGYVPPSRGVSGGAFFTVLFLMLAMAGFIFYTLYYNKQYNLFDNNAGSIATAPLQETEQASLPAGEEPLATAPVEETQSAATENNIANNQPPAASKPVIKDSVPNIIGKADAQKTVQQTKKQQVAAAPITKTSEADKTEMEETAPPVTESDAASTTPPATPPVQQQPAREPIAKYKVTSKANFYTAPDENALGRSFINGGNKTVEAYEEENGFIYVEYVNERGMLNKGWLSKKDLTKE